MAIDREKYLEIRNLILDWQEAYLIQNINITEENKAEIKKFVNCIPNGKSIYQKIFFASAACDIFGDTQLMFIINEFFSFLMHETMFKLKLKNKEPYKYSLNIQNNNSNDFELPF